MAASRQEISAWFDLGVERGATHMLVLCDTYDWGDYPVFAKSAQEAKNRAANPGDMQRVMEVYNLRKDKEPQLDQFRVYDVDEVPAK